MEHGEAQPIRDLGRRSVQPVGYDQCRYRRPQEMSLDFLGGEFRIEGGRRGAI